MSSNSNFMQNFKAHIWDVCVNQSIFHAMQESNLPLIKQIFENVIQNYQIQILQDNEDKGPLVQHIVGEIRNQVQNMNMTSKEEIFQQKKDKFEQDLELKQNEFNQLMKKDVPQEVDFGSIQDEPLGNENLEMMLKEQMKQRENIEFNNPSAPAPPPTQNKMDIKEEKTNLLENIIVKPNPMSTYTPEVEPQQQKLEMDEEMKSYFQKIIKTQEAQNLLLEKLIHSQIHILKQMK